MRKILAAATGIVSLFISNSCKNDLDAIAPYQESVVIYGLLDQNDTANYIRVNKVFLTAGNANETAQIQDSVYFKPGEASVKVEKYWNGIKKQTYVFGETYEVPLQPGTFNTNQLIYKSTAAFSSDSSGRYFEYKLVVTNNNSGKQYTATTKLIKNFSPGNTASLCSPVIGQDCFFNQGLISILPVPNAKTTMKIIAPVNAAMCGFKMHMYYTNIFNDNSTSVKYFQYSQSNKNTSSVSGGEVIDFSFSGTSFFSALANSVPSETNLKERVADSIRFIFEFGGEEYKLYREINNTTGSFGQQKPIYTNISNGGIGVFSSRTSIAVAKKFFDYTGGPGQTTVITTQTVQALISSSITCHLLFRGPNWPQNTGC